MEAFGRLERNNVAVNDRSKVRNTPFDDNGRDDAPEVESVSVLVAKTRDDVRRAVDVRTVEDVRHHRGGPQRLSGHAEVARRRSADSYHILK